MILVTSLLSVSISLSKQLAFKEISVLYADKFIIYAKYRIWLFFLVKLIFCNWYSFSSSSIIISLFPALSVIQHSIYNIINYKL